MRPKDALSHASDRERSGASGSRLSAPRAHSSSLSPRSLTFGARRGERSTGAVGAELRPSCTDSLHQRTAASPEVAPSRQHAGGRSSRDVRKHPYALDHIAPLIRELNQLDHARVLQANTMQQEPLAPWLPRFGHVATADDLPPIEAWLEDSSSHSGIRAHRSTGYPCFAAKSFKTE